MRFRERMTEEMGLQCFLKTDIDDADVTFSGSVPVGQQQPEKLDLCWLKDGCVGLQAI